jgi:hypothetical protein
MDEPIPLDESDLEPEMLSALFGPVKVPFLDPSWLVASGLVAAFLCGPWWPPSAYQIISLAMFVLCGPLVPRVCEVNQSGLRVRMDSPLLRLTIVRVPWAQLDRYSWRQQRQGRSLVLKVCRNRPGVVDNTYTWEFPAMPQEGQVRFDEVAKVYLHPQRSA